jgi:transcriptional regulator with XRE-family HTH domain
MSPLLPNYLRTLRMQWGLTQPELASLLGVSESALSKFETQALAPTKNLILGIDVIFGQGAREAFPALYAQTERNIMRRAAAFSERLETDSGDTANKKRKLLAEMIERSEVDNKHL